MLNFVWNTGKFWWNETDDEILPVSTKSLSFEIYFFSFPWELFFPVLIQAIIYVLSFKKMYKWL